MPRAVSTDLSQTLGVGDNIGTDYDLQDKIGT
eukprot:COSAG02_NODE_7553_length_2963_cov_4.504888_2_plen_31_part_01